MKKGALLFIAVLSVITGYSQNAKVTSAYSYLKDYNSTKEISMLNNAKEAIDLANNNEKTKDETNTQLYRGQIYLTIYDNNLRTQTEMINTTNDPNKKVLIGYQNTSVTELDTAYVAFTKARKLDVKNKNKSDIDPYLERIAAHFENKAIVDYNGKRFAAALPSFEKTNQIKGGNDTTLLAYCAFSAERSNNYDKAKTYYLKMIDAKLGRGTTYSSLITVYLNLKDTTAAMDLLKKGRAAYPTDVSLLITETNYFLNNNKSMDALNNLNIAIQAKPSEPNLYLARGNLYDNLANPKDAKGAELNKPVDYDDKIKLAEADYKKAIDLKPDYFEALYDLGALYNNCGVVINKKADKITDQKKYEAENAKANEAFNKAMPVLEKALAVNAADRNTMIALKQIYSRLNLTDKLKEIDAKLKK